MGPSERTIPELLDAVASAHPDDVAFRFKRDGAWRSWTWRRARAEFSRLAKGLIALGVEPGDRVGILSGTRLEWALTDFGSAEAGSVIVGIYPSNLAADCAYILEHADIGVLIVEDEQQLVKIREVRGGLPLLRHVVLIDGEPRPDDDVLRWDELIARGESVGDETLRRRAAAIDPEDLASLVYTSGTTGRPKGAMLTHDNLVFTSWSVGQQLHTERHFESLLFLPLAHVFARMMMYCCLRGAHPMAFAESFIAVPQNLQEIRPHFFASVPRVYEKAHEKVLARLEQAPAVKRKLFDWAVRVGHRAADARRERRRPGLALSLQHALADRLVLSKIRDAFGGRLIWAISGAAPLNPTLAYFFDACGVTILEGIGMTENTSFSNVNEYDSNRIGTVGRTGPGIEQRLADDGEVLYRGRNVMKGYFKDPESTAETIDGDGWLHTGDIGEIDDDGYLRITDRKKELIITAGGKNIAPQRIERVMRTSPYISHVMAYGDRRKYIVALVTLNVENVRDWAARHGVEADDEAELAADERVERLIAGEIEARNHELASFETVKQFRLLPADFTIETGELTATMKLKRRAVVERYGEVIDAMYEDRSTPA